MNKKADVLIEKSIFTEVRIGLCKRNMKFDD